MSQITVKGKIYILYRAFPDRSDDASGGITLILPPENDLASFRLKQIPADWVEGQAVEIIIRSEEK